VKSIKPDFHEYKEQREKLGDEFFPTSNSLIIGTHYPTKDRIDRLVADVDRQTSKREKWHRRRPFDPEEQIDFINERNARFNRKLERFYGEYTQEIKQNLERGTAV